MLDSNSFIVVMMEKTDGYHNLCVCVFGLFSDYFLCLLIQGTKSFHDMFICCE